MLEIVDVVRDRSVELPEAIALFDFGGKVVLRFGTLVRVGRQHSSDSHVKTAKAHLMQYFPEVVDYMKTYFGGTVNGSS